ncbi:MAG: hypothetical protein WCL22_04425 [bacterium]
MATKKVKSTKNLIVSEQTDNIVEPSIKIEDTPVKKTRAKKVVEANDATTTTTTATATTATATATTATTATKSKSKKTNDSVVIEEKNDETKTKKVIEKKVKVDTPVKTDTAVKKTRAKKTAIEPLIEATTVSDFKPVLSIVSNNNTNTNSNNNNNDSNNDDEYNILKKEWAILCEKIKELNKERDFIELQKNQLLNKLWILGDNNKKTDKLFAMTDKPKPVLNTKNKLLINSSDSSSDSDSSDDLDNSDDSEDDSDEESLVKTPIPAKKIVRKPVICSDAEDSD